MFPMPKDLPHPPISANTEIVLKKRYYQHNLDTGHVEDARELFWRVSSTIAQEEEKYSASPYTKEALAEEFYSLMTQWKFLPNSPTLMNAGTELGQLSACFVLPVGDSIEEIFDAVKYAAMIHKSGGGTGFSFTRIRPAQSRVGSTGGVASGPLSFLRIFNTATEQIKQGGTRRGANMGILRIDHPDILEFIKAKEEEGEFNNFNLSVGLTEEFMQAVENNETYSLIAPHNGEEQGRLQAKEVFDLLVKKAWQSGDPGIVFLDRINRDNPNPDQGTIESTNPCGEQPLLPYEACNLGSINLAQFVTCVATKEQSAEKCIDWKELDRVIQLSVRFLDNVIDASRFPLERIAEKVQQNRKIGLGVMGFADMLFQLGIAYDSEEGTQIGEKVMEFINKQGHEASATLAEERGAFPAYATSTFAKEHKGPYRNATVTTIAPTGTLSIIAGCSSGVEPLFALCFTRNILDGEKLVEVNTYFEKALSAAGAHSPELMEAVISKGSIRHMDFLPQHMRHVFATAMDISPQWHLKMQAAFQRHTDNAVSKTVNLPHNASIDDINRIYWMAYSEGCKGVTVYRDGCKSVQVLATGEGQKKQDGENTQSMPNANSAENNVDNAMDLETLSHANPSASQDQSNVQRRPDLIQGFTQKVQTGLGGMYLTVNEVNGRPFEVFATIGKSGRSITAKAEAIGRLVSLALRSGVSVKDIVSQIKGIGGEHPVFRGKGLLLSIPDAIAWVLERRYLQGADGKSVVYDHVSSIQHDTCPDCGSELIYQEGCSCCQACSFNKCG